jgi:hypothetical protein
MRAYVFSTTLLLIIFVFLGKSFAGDEVNNGGGISEGNIAKSYLNLERYIDLCLNLPSCSLNKEEQALLSEIKTGLKGEYQNKKQLQFISERLNPGTFVIDGEMKIAKTGDEIGSVIMVNKDLLYHKNSRTGLTEGIGLEKAVQILVHEMGHHHGQKDHTLLDLLGAKVSMSLSKNMITAKLLAESEGVKAVVINGKSEEEFPQILIYVFDQIIDVTAKFKKVLKCKSLGLPIPVNLPTDIVISFSKPTGALFHNIYWDKYKFGGMVKKNTGKLVLKGHLSKICGKADNFFFNNKKYKALIRLKIKKKKNDKGQKVWAYEEGSLKVKEDYDPWWKIIRIPFLTDI